MESPPTRSPPRPRHRGRPPRCSRSPRSPRARSRRASTASAAGRPSPRGSSTPGPKTPRCRLPRRRMLRKGTLRRRPARRLAETEPQTREPDPRNLRARDPESPDQPAGKPDCRSEAGRRGPRLPWMRAVLPARDPTDGRCCRRQRSERAPAGRRDPSCEGAPRGSNRTSPDYSVQAPVDDFFSPDEVDSPLAIHGLLESRTGAR